MKVTGVLLLSLLSMVALQVGSVYGAIFEIPDELLDSAREITIEGDVLREKRQLKATGEGSEHGGFIRLDGQRNLYDNGKTKVDGNAFYQHQYTRGMPSQHGAGLGAEVSHNVWKGRNGQALDVYGNYGREWHSGPRPNNHNFGAGLRYRF